MADDRQGRSLAERLLRWGRRPGEDGGAVPAGPEKALPTKVLPKFVAALSHRESPVLMDLGPVVGPNVSFFGEHLGCKLHVEDLYADVENFAKEGRAGDLAAHFTRRLPREDASVDGILCWDLFDYLDKASARELGKQLARILRPGGVLAGFFTTQAVPDPVFTKFVISDEHTLVHRPYRAAAGRTLVLVTRDIGLLFPGLRVAETFLLLTHTREILFKK
jgi:SAM-dependent methyltransferase